MTILLIIAWCLSGALGWYMVMKGKYADGFDMFALVCCLGCGPISLGLCLIAKGAMWLIDHDIKIRIP